MGLWEKGVDLVSIRIKSDRVRPFFCWHTIDSVQLSGIEYVQDSRITDRDVEKLKSGIEKDYVLCRSA